MDPKYKHEYLPNREGLCKQIVGHDICHLPEDAIVHQRARDEFVAKNQCDLIDPTHEHLGHSRKESLRRGIALHEAIADELRDTLFIAVLGGLCANPNVVDLSLPTEKLVRWAREIADEALIERER